MLSMLAVTNDGCCVIDIPIATWLCDKVRELRVPAVAVVLVW